MEIMLFIGCNKRDVKYLIDIKDLCILKLEI